MVYPFCKPASMALALINTLIPITLDIRFEA
jgi:hypothetical protein